MGDSRDTRKPRKGSRIRIRDGWDEAGREGVCLGKKVTSPHTGQEWLPVCWDDEEDPDFFKPAAIEVVRRRGAGVRNG